MNDTPTVPARYFDGVSSRLYRVQFHIEHDQAVMTGDAERCCPVGELRISERTRHAARRITFPAGDYLEIDDRVAFNQMLGKLGHRDSFVVRAQQSWRATLGLALLTCVIVVLVYLYVLPFAADHIARSLPPEAESAIGKGALGFLDQHVFDPSKLAPEKQQMIRDRFAHLIAPKVDGAMSAGSQPEIVFRHSKSGPDKIAINKIGPNAFALPSRQIVVTDELVDLLDNDDALMGVLGHELGHLNEHHLTRRLIQSSAIGIGATLLFGDVSGLVATIPPVLLDLKYSRDAEREADDYGIAMLKANGIPVESFAEAMEKLEQSSKSYTNNSYLSTHPATAERIARIRQAE